MAITRNQAVAAAKAISKGKNGRTLIDYLKQESKANAALGSSDPRKQDANVAIHDFVQVNVVDLLNQKEK